MSTNLIDTYVSEVGRRLPRKTRSDIEAEIRSILQDMLEERSQKTGKAVDEEMTLEILKEYGAPEKVAATYQGERYLIGPRLYPIFMMVMRIVLIVIGVLAAIGLGIALFHTTLAPMNALETILKAFANFGTSALTALGNIVIIFAIVEWALFRAGGKVDIKGLPAEKEWDPRSLTRLSTTNQVKMGETIVEIVGCFVAIVIFNFYPQIIGFTASLNGVVGIRKLGGRLWQPDLCAAAFRCLLRLRTLVDLGLGSDHYPRYCPVAHGSLECGNTHLPDWPEDHQYHYRCIDAGCSLPAGCYYRIPHHCPRRCRGRRHPDDLVEPGRAGRLVAYDYREWD